MRTISIETAIESIRQDIVAAGPRHGCDPDVIARVYSVLCADCDEPVCVVTGDKTASLVYVEGKPLAPAPAPKKKATKTWAGLAVVQWTAEDIQKLRPEWSAQRCNEFLERNEDEIQCEMIARGWSVIENCLRHEA